MFVIFSKRYRGFWGQAKIPPWIVEKSLTKVIKDRISLQFRFLMKNLFCFKAVPIIEATLFFVITITSEWTTRIPWIQTRRMALVTWVTSSISSSHPRLALVVNDSTVPFNNELKDIEGRAMEWTFTEKVQKRRRAMVEGEVTEWGSNAASGIALLWKRKYFERRTSVKFCFSFFGGLTEQYLTSHKSHLRGRKREHPLLFFTFAVTSFTTIYRTIV